MTVQITVCNPAYRQHLIVSHLFVESMHSLQAILLNVRTIKYGGFWKGERRFHESVHADCG